ncbi:uncharacterized protein [Mycetomoellerius zeteki]|uniref:uncharacterized protein n=1 Tax=Mycetomoellerius zeteki TaxID=64791 RepID=UPI00084EA610|nr:PREDICTED: uncharacterized protein LOC108724923 [Trachymyrmex zeteki]
MQSETYHRNLIGVHECHHDKGKTDPRLIGRQKAGEKYRRAKYRFCDWRFCLASNKSKIHRYEEVPDGVAFDATSKGRENIERHFAPIDLRLRSPLYRSRLRRVDSHRNIAIPRFSCDFFVESKCQILRINSRRECRMRYQVIFTLRNYYRRVLSATSLFMTSGSTGWRQELFANFSF